jgi:DNA primase
MIEHAASELLGQQFDEAEAEEEFRDTLEKLREGEQKRLFADLQAKAQQFGVAGLSAAEKQAYIQLLSGRQNRG